jgi:hypothetical protein
VRYEDFDPGQIVKGFSSYFLMLKRPSFAHEREVRATILLPEEEKSSEVPCDMEKPIVRVHVAPGAPAMFLGAVRPTYTNRCGLR